MLLLDPYYRTLQGFEVSSTCVRLLRAILLVLEVLAHSLNQVFSFVSDKQVTTNLLKSY